MLAYQVKLAFKSLRRNPVLSILLVAAIALGIGVSTAFVTMYHVSAGNPIPDKSERLYYVEIDSWDPAEPFDDDRPELPPSQLTYRDVTSVMGSGIPNAESAMYKTTLTVHPEGDNSRPFRAEVRLCSGDFFPMFEAPFRYGGGWDRGADEAPDPVVVIDADTNRRLFGGANSVGRNLRVEDRSFRVVGVLDQWWPTPKYYDPHNGAFRAPEAIFMPFAFGRELEAVTTGNMWGWREDGGDTYKDHVASEDVWLQLWVELASTEQVEAYRSFLDAYVREQQRLGRLQRPLNNRLLTVMEWLEQKDVVPEQARAMLVISLLFLAVCSLNLIGLFLGKFLARSSEVGVRRALGASRGAVFAQHIVECEVVGLLGGALGLGLSLVVLGAVNDMLGSSVHFRLDGSMVAAGIGLSLLAGLVAGLYPAWRVCRLAPATHLKNQ